MLKNLQIKVSGRVQGVGFRYFAKCQAEKLNIKGFVQNQTDDSVYLEVEQESAVLDKFIAWCKNGSPWSKVKSIDVKVGEVKNHSQFIIEV
ncbi:MAG: acylphosphatase [Parcubacteria group bacterium GW2011_GWA2_36_10]|nr:MAG: acylphosphatase [Parcubacteria group bacterium GW2011_GWA2_36_10]